MPTLVPCSLYTPLWKRADMKLIEYLPNSEQRHETEYANANPDFQSGHLNKGGRSPRTRSDNNTTFDKRIDDYLHVFVPGIDADHAQDNADYLLHQIVGSENNFARYPDIPQKTLKSIKPTYALHEEQKVVGQTADKVFDQLSQALEETDTQTKYRCGVTVMHHEYLLDDIESQIIRSPEHIDHIKRVLVDDCRPWSVIPAITYIEY